MLRANSTSNPASAIWEASSRHYSGAIATLPSGGASSAADIFGNGGWRMRGCRPASLGSPTALSSGVGLQRPFECVVDAACADGHARCGKRRWGCEAAMQEGGRTVGVISDSRIADALGTRCPGGGRTISRNQTVDQVELRRRLEGRPPSSAPGRARPVRFMRAESGSTLRWLIFRPVEVSWPALARETEIEAGPIADHRPSTVRRRPCAGGLEFEKAVCRVLLGECAFAARRMGVPTGNDGLRKNSSDRRTAGPSLDQPPQKRPRRVSRRPARTKRKRTRAKKPAAVKCRDAGGREYVHVESRRIRKRLWKLGSATAVFFRRQLLGSKSAGIGVSATRRTRLRGDGFGAAVPLLTIRPWARPLNRF